MKKNNSGIARHFFSIAVMMFIIALVATPAISGGYAALDGVQRVKAVFDVSQGSPQTANIVFWAVKNVNDDASVRSLSEPWKKSV
jgi:hypothetical protein